MKKIHFITFYLICTSAIAQNFEPVYKQMPTISAEKFTPVTQDRGFVLIGNPTSTSDLPPATIGKPYINEDFIEARVNNGEKLFRLRYNNHEDVIEYEKSKNEILFLNKEANTLIEFTNGKKLYLKDVKYGKKTENGYFENVIKGNNVSIFKNQKITYSEGNKKSNGYSQTSQPEYKPEKEKLYIEIDEILYPFESPKDIIKLLPNQEKDLKKYLKENKISLESITDMKKLIVFIDGIY